MTTREAIVSALKNAGKLRADTIAATLDLTPMAVRQHLYQLAEEGAVEAISESKGRGRPAKFWQLTDKANVYFPDAHRDLSLELLDSFKSLMGDVGLNDLVRIRTERQQARYKAALETTNDFTEKLGLLAAERRSEGYMADIIQTDSENWLLIENHCPICEAAKACSGLCSEELWLFRSLFPKATIERTEHILKGARRCAYQITLKSE